MKNVFIYKISNNYDWFLITNSEEMHYPCIMYYESFKESIIEDLREITSEEDFKIYTSSITAKEKLIHYINSWYEYGGVFLIDQSNEVYHIVCEKIDSFADSLLLGEEEAEAFLSSLITKLDLEFIFSLIELEYFENKDEIIGSIERYKQELKDNGLQKIYNEKMKIVKL